MTSASDARRWIPASLLPLALITAGLFHVDAQSPPAGGPVGHTPDSQPKLVVMLVIDQFRADYADQYGKAWAGGLHDLMTKGAYFTDAAYPYGTTKTCVGHATIGTGTLPTTHGMVDNEWFDPTTREFVTCTEDPTSRALAFGGETGTEHHSARRMLVPTLADELKRQSKSPARVVSLSVKARSAIGLAGHGGPNTVIVWQEEAGTWTTSTALTDRLSPEVNAYVKAHPILSAKGQPWDRLLPEESYLFADRAPAEPADAVFPHLLEEPIRTARITQTFVDLWSRTPFVDAFLGDLAGTLVDQLKLGQRQATDVLAVSFSGLDLVGHPYGPRSHEVQDTLARLDQTIGKLIAVLDRAVGRDRYVLALSADHGVATLPEQAEPWMDAGRMNTLLPVGTAIDAVLDKALGKGSYVEAISGTYLYLRPGVLDRIKSSPTVLKEIAAAAQGIRGIANVYWSMDLEATTPTSDPILARLRRSHMAGRSGDLAIVLRQNWILAATGTTHGSPYEYDSRVPVVLFGAGIQPGRYTTAATPVDIAPTLAALTRVKLGRVDGRVLTEALKGTSH